MHTEKIDKLDLILSLWILVNLAASWNKGKETKAKKNGQKKTKNENLFLIINKTKNRFSVLDFKRSRVSCK